MSSGNQSSRGRHQPVVNSVPDTQPIRSPSGRSSGWSVALRDPAPHASGARRQQVPNPYAVALRGGASRVPSDSLAGASRPIRSLRVVHLAGPHGFVGAAPRAGGAQGQPLIRPFQQTHLYCSIPRMLSFAEFCSTCLPVEASALARDISR
jgi:hypothetical protein